MKITIGKKILTGFILCSILLLVVASISVKNSERLIDTNKLVNHSYEVLYEFEQILVNCTDAETGERGFIITGDKDYLEPFNNSRSRLLEDIDKVKVLTKNNPVQQKNINAIKNLADTLLKHLELCIETRKAKDFEKTKELVATGKGKRVLDEIRKIIDSSITSAQTLLAQRKQASESDARNFIIIFIVLLLIIAAVLVSVYLIVTRNFSAIKQAQDETAAKNWTLAGSGELAKNMQGDKPLAELCQGIINHLATYLNAQMGAVYIAEDDGLRLKLVSTYAVDIRKKDLSLVHLGEGIVGQSAAEKRTILLIDIPKNYFSVYTGFGELLPKNIMTFPIIFEGRVAGVIELGSIHDFTKLERQYPEIVADSIAIAITSSRARERTKELLEETQRQAEELEAQQEELKQINDALEGKTQMLEKSEAELKTQQEELQQTNEELEEKTNLLEEQKERLELAKKEVEMQAGELEVSSKYKSEFLANMSHELRTPLNSILILAQLLKENKTHSLGEKEVEYARNIHSSGTDLLNLINEILDLSKVEAGKIELEIEEVHIGSVANNLHSVFGEIAKSKSIEFKIVYQEEKFKNPVYTDQQRLEQILKNLLSNAFKFTGGGGQVFLDIDTVPPDHPVKSAKPGLRHEVIAFSVSDTGIGIPEDKQGIIFEAFQQADGSTKRKYGGTGLGLSISQELAHALGGQIRLRSKEGEGSQFTLYLPAKFDRSAIVNRETELKKPAEKNIRKPHDHAGISDPQYTIGDDRHTVDENDKTILIIEDDENFAKVLLDFFREKGYKGIVARQGNTGLSLARHYSPDAIILDMQLPVMNGSEVLKHLKIDPELRHIPVQVISGYDKRKEGMELGAFDFVQKPVSMADIQAAFERIEDFIRKKIKKLLIVEDNRQQNIAIRELIGNGDVKSYSVYTGTEAYEMMQKEKFDCIIIDLGLPDMSGIQLMEGIKANDEFNRIPIIVYTGKDLDKEEVIRLNKLADTVVLKTASSKERLLDETTLFLHRMESRLPKEKQQIIRKLHRTDEVLKNKKVLIVDDDMRNIYSLTNVLEDQGMVCITAENGRMAVTLLKEQRDIDIVLMDVMMPEMDGYEATHAIRNMKEFEKIPVIALTAKAMKGDREKCLEAGMSDYIAKPVNIEQLLSLMRVWLYQ